MRIIQAEQITQTVTELYMHASRHLGEGVLDALSCAARQERGEGARQRLAQSIENAQLSANTLLPLCQDTGIAVVYLSIGQDVHITGDVYAAVNEGIRCAVKRGFLRASMRDPITGENTGDNTPALVRIHLVPGDRVTITVAPKGGGSENKGQVRMLTPADGMEGAADFAVQVVREAGGSPCPPVIVGVGIGGAMEDAAMLSKHALLRCTGQPSENEVLVRWEQAVLMRINQLGIGAQGLGGSITALAVHVESMPTHIASLPVAVSLACHCHRHETRVI